MKRIVGIREGIGVSREVNFPAKYSVKTEWLNRSGDVRPREVDFPR